ncbi:MAG: DNA-processing protein DprA [Pseudomonadota bacterium]
MSPSTALLLSYLAYWPRRAIAAALQISRAQFDWLATDELNHVLAQRLNATQQRESPWQIRSPEQYNLLGYFDALFPAVLRTIPDPPLLLWYRGELDCLNRPALAVVGARRASRQGLEIATQLGQDFAAAGVVVVSGLAYGIDAAAHRGALQAGGPSIAVLGGGMDKLYPRNHTRLAEELVTNGGLILTEYPPNAPPLPGQFPERNRLVSGLSNGVVVVEASRRSGSLITARLALEQGRDVYAVPGPVHSALAVGCHDLIRQGAELVTAAEQVLVALQVSVPSPPSETPQTLSPDEQRVLTELAVGAALAGDELMQSLGWTAARLAATLAPMELRGIVTRSGQGYIARLPRDNSV